MNDLVINVRLKADGSGLVGQLQATEASTGKMGAEFADAGTKARAMAAGTGEAERAVQGLAKAENQAGAAATALAADARQATQAVDALEQAQRKHGSAAADGTKSIDQQRAGVAGLGQSIQAMGAQLTGGTDIMQVMAEQGGQLASSIDDIGLDGAAGSVAAFFTGPWSTALTIAAAVLGPLVTGLFDTAEAAEAAEKASAELAQRQLDIANFFDLATGKILEQNDALIFNAILKRQEKIDDASEGILAKRDSAFGTARAAAKGPTYTQAGMALPDISSDGEIRAAIDAAGDSVVLLDRNLRELGKRRPELAPAIKEINELTAQATLSYREVGTLQAEIASLQDGRLAASLRKPGTAPRTPRTRSPSASSRSGESGSGSDAENRLARLRDQFSDTPNVVRQINGALRQLDDIMADLAEKKPPNFEALLADARELRPVIEAALNEPLEDFVKAQTQSFQIQELVVRGRLDEAAALRAVFQLERQMGPLNEQQRDAVLGTVQALEAQERQLQRVRAEQQLNLNAVEDIRSVIAQTLYEGPSSLVDLPSRLLDVFTRFKADQLLQLFDPEFQKIKDQVTGATTVENASVRMASALDSTRGGLAQLEQAAAGAAGALLGAPATGTIDGHEADHGPQDIVVTGIKPNVRDIFADIFRGLAKTAGIDDVAAGQIGKIAAKGLEGAATGALVNSVFSPIAKSLGIKTSQTGAQIGGAIGAFVPIPGGEIIGSIAGSILGGLLTKTPRGNAVITSASAPAQTSGQLGGELGGTATSVQDGINRIAQALGAEVGGFKVSIGKYGNSYRVSGSGDPRVSDKRAPQTIPLIFDADDEAGAIKAALADAIKDGAILGISSAMQRALQSTKDIDKAVTEALKVRELEKLIGGLGGQLKGIFEDFDKVAADRVRMAKAYGLDLLRVEQINGEARAKLVEDTLKQRVGSLKDLLANIQYGDLFEGDAATRRNAILTEIADARQDVDAGVEGAADRLAELTRQLITTSREAFGTAGAEFEGDRASGIADIERVIRLEEDRIKAAAAVGASTTAAITAGNALQSDANALIAGTNARLDQLLGRGRLLSPDFALTER